MPTTPTITVRWLPTKPPRPVPDVLTADEAALFLRLENKDPERTLQRYREIGQLKSVKVGNHLRYRLCDLDEFLRIQQEDMSNA